METWDISLSESRTRYIHAIWRWDIFAHSLFLTLWPNKSIYKVLLCATKSGKPFLFHPVKECKKNCATMKYRILSAQGSIKHSVQVLDAFLNKSIALNKLPGPLKWNKCEVCEKYTCLAHFIAFILISAHLIKPSSKSFCLYIRVQGAL